MVKKEVNANRELEKWARFRKLLAEQDRLKAERKVLIRKGQEHRHISDRLHELGWEINHYWG